MVVAEHAALQLARVSLRDAQGVDSRPLGALHNVSVTLQSGVHAFVGRPADGTAALCEAIAGRRAPAVGVVTIAGREPRRSASTRRRCGVLLPHSSLAGGATVRHALASMSLLRGVSLEGCLESFGATQLLARTLRSLRPDEARAVELAALLALPDPPVLAVYEPSSLVALDTARLHQQLAKRAATGTCVVLATSAPEDLNALPDHVYLLEAGKLWGRDEEVGWSCGPADPAHRVGVRAPVEALSLWLAQADARHLTRALTARSEITSVSCGLYPDGLAEVVVSGADLNALALAVADIVADGHLDVAAMQSRTRSVETMRAAARAHRGRIEQAARAATTTPLLQNGPVT